MAEDHRSGRESRDTRSLETTREIRLIGGPALTLRLRAGFGVSAKADLLSFLIGLGGAAADLKVIATATAFTTTALRTAADEMTLAGFIREIEGPPSAYYADVKAWAELLQAYRPDMPDAVPFPRWHFWYAIFVFLARVIEWADTAESSKRTGYVVSSRAYDLYESYKRQLKQAQVNLPVAIAGGADYVTVF